MFKGTDWLKLPLWKFENAWWLNFMEGDLVLIGFINMLLVIVSNLCLIYEFSRTHQGTNMIFISAKNTRNIFPAKFHTDICKILTKYKQFKFRHTQRCQQLSYYRIDTFIDW